MQNRKDFERSLTGHSSDTNDHLQQSTTDVTVLR
jgi:hypothetical protein